MKKIDLVHVPLQGSAGLATSHLKDYFEKSFTTSHVQQALKVKTPSEKSSTSEATQNNNKDTTPKPQK